MSGTTGAALAVWLPPFAHFAASGPVRAALVRGDRLAPGSAGFLAGLDDYFPGLAKPLPVGALTREYLAHDAGDALWLAADPAWARPDINGVRLMACGNLRLDAAQATALAEPLQPLFAESGMALEVSSPDHWHVRLPAGTELAEFSAPEQGMGEDLIAHLPQGAAGKRWLLLQNELQVMLHQNPLNAARHAHRRPPINTLWLWGGGVLPARMASALAGVISNDLVLCALAARAGIGLAARTEDALAAAAPGSLVDLQDLPAGDVEATWWPLLAPRAARQALVLHFASGERFGLRPWHRWRVWRRAPH